MAATRRSRHRDGPTAGAQRLPYNIGDSASECRSCVSRHGSQQEPRPAPASGPDPALHPPRHLGSQSLPAVFEGASCVEMEDGLLVRLTADRLLRCSAGGDFVGPSSERMACGANLRGRCAGDAPTHLLQFRPNLDLKVLCDTECR